MICWPIAFGQDWTLMQQSYLILSLEEFDEDWIQRLPNQKYCSPLCVQCVGFRIQSKTLKRFNMGTWPLGVDTTAFFWPKSPWQATKSSGAWLTGSSELCVILPSPRCRPSPQLHWKQLLVQAQWCCIGGKKTPLSPACSSTVGGTAQEGATVPSEAPHSNNGGRCHCRQHHSRYTACAILIVSKGTFRLHRGVFNGSSWYLGNS